jgi:RimJ/RimL family protein N-acetyltransferase
MRQFEYLLSSERLGFRSFEDIDFESLSELDTDPEVRAHFPDGVLTHEQVRERISKNQACFRQHGFSDFAVFELESGDFVGRSGFGLVEGGEIEVGYVFRKESWGRGLAQESLRVLLAWADSHLDVSRVIAYAPEGHSASFNVMTKAGMRYFKTDIMRGVSCDFFEHCLRSGP